MIFTSGSVVMALFEDAGEHVMGRLATRAAPAAFPQPTCRRREKER